VPSKRKFTKNAPIATETLLSHWGECDLVILY